MNACVQKTSIAILDEFSALLEEFNLKIPNNDECNQNSCNPIFGEAYEVLQDSIQEKLMQFQKDYIKN